MNDTEKAPPQLKIWDEPSKIADFISHRRDTSSEEKSIKYNFSDFIKEVGTTDFNDAYQVRATLESQAYILGSAFQYLMLEGDWKQLQFILKTQKVMRDTIALMDQYPPLQYSAPDREAYTQLSEASAIFDEDAINDAASLDN